MNGAVRWHHWPAAWPAGTAFSGLLLGILTAYGQGLLPSVLGPLANSAGSWSLVAFLLAMAARRPRNAALAAALVLAMALAGYVIGAAIRGYPSSMALIVFWTAAAVSVGPLLGFAAHAVRNGEPRRAIAGVAVMSGVLVGEGVYGLVVVAATTSPPYWYGSIVAGVVLLAVVSVRRLRRANAIVIAVLATAAVAAAFFAVYRANLIALLS